YCMQAGNGRGARGPPGRLLLEESALAGGGAGASLGQHQTLVELLDPLVQLGDLLLELARDPLVVGLQPRVLALEVADQLIAPLDGPALIAQLRAVLADLLVL